MDEIAGSQNLEHFQNQPHQGWRTMSGTPAQLAWRALSIARKPFRDAVKAWERGELTQEQLSEKRRAYVEARDVWESLVTVGRRAA